MRGARESPPMKPSFVPLLGTVLALAALSVSVMAAPPERKLSPRDEYERGRAAYHRGDLVTARGCFEKVLKAVPDFELAKVHLAQVAAAERELAKVPRSLKVSRATPSGRVRWEGVPVADALEATRRLVEKAAGVPVGLRQQLPADLLQREVVIQMSDGTIDDLLEALAWAGGFRISHETEGLAALPAGPTGKWDAGTAERPTAEAAARKLVLQRLEVQDATLEEALAFLRLKLREGAGDGPVPTIILRADVAAAGKTVTMDLRNISLAEALRMAAMLAGDLEVRWFPWGAGLEPKAATAANAARGPQ